MDQPSPPVTAAGKLSQRQINLILAGTLMATFLGALDQAVIAPALSTIGRELNDFENLSWVVASYLVVGTAVTPVYGKLSDVYGRRPVLLTAIVIFIIGSVACALADSVLMLVLARALQGLGGGGLMSISFTIQGDIIPPRERGKYQPYFSAVWLSSSILGPMLGGFLADRFHWSLIFWINVPLGLVILALNSHFLKLVPRNERRHKIDYAGAVLMIVATSSLLLAVTWGGRTYAWTSWQVLGMAVLAISAGTLLFRRLYSVPEPFIPPNILFSRSMRSPLIATFLTSGAFVPAVVFLPLYFNAVHGLSVAQTGAALIPIMAGTMPGAMLAGLLTMKLPNYNITAVIGVSMASVALVPLAIAPDLPFPLVMALLLVHGVGLGTIFPVTTISIQNTVPLHQLGTAMSVQNLVRNLAASILVTAFGVLLINSLGLAPGAVLGAEAGSHGEVGGFAGADFLGAFRLFFAAMAVVYALAVIFLMRMEVKPLRGKAEQT